MHVLDKLTNGEEIYQTWMTNDPNLPAPPRTSIDLPVNMVGVTVIKGGIQNENYVTSSVSL